MIIYICYQNIIHIDLYLGILGNKEKSLTVRGSGGKEGGKEGSYLIKRPLSV